MHIFVYVGVKKQLPLDGDAVCMGCGTSVLYCDQREIIEQYFIMIIRKTYVVHCAHYEK